MKYKHLRILLISFPFLALIFFPILNGQFAFIKDIKNFENRAMAAKPVFKDEKIDSFPKRYEKFYNDNFSLRARMLKTFNYLSIFILKKIPSDKFVIMGKDGWLFIAGEEFDAFTGKNNLTQKELSDYKNELELRQKYLKERGCKFYFMIAPVKACIYPEKVPARRSARTGPSMGEELLLYLQKNSTINTIDLYKVLKEDKKIYSTYYATDNHWTRPGAFFSANEFISRLQKDFPGISPLSLNDFTIRIKDTLEGNTTKILASGNLFPDTSYLLSPKKPLSVRGRLKGYKPDEHFAYKFEEVREIKNSSAPRILIISDSFGTDLFPLLAERFSKTVKIWDNWQYKLNEKIVEIEKPDIVLLLIHEKNLRSLMRHRTTPG